MWWRIFGFIAWKTFYPFVRLFFILAFRFKVKGAENIPRRGGFILACNHQSGLDPVIFGAAMPWRILHFVAKDSLFKIPVFKWLIKLLFAFPIRRGTLDYSAINNTLKFLRMGDGVLIFVEGTRSKDGSLQRGKPGAGLIVYRSDVPVIPALVIGSFEIMPTGAKMMRFGRRLEVRIGCPIDVSRYRRMKESKETYQAISDRIMEELARLQRGRGDDPSSLANSKSLGG
ncbi:MAG: lysophospholipid acyltransferase family protein [bacterium]